MSHTTNYLNRFEIEERIEEKLPFKLQEKYRKIRITSKAEVTEEHRLTQTKKRIEHWEQLSDKLLNNILQQLLDNTSSSNKEIESLTSYLDNNNIEIEEQLQTNYNMTENNNNIANDIASAMTAAMTMLLDKQKPNDNNDFIKKPKVYNGERDAQIIDLWISSIEDYCTFKGYDNEKMYTLGKTLLDHDARTWLYIVEQDQSGPLNDWTKLKRLLIQTFKPANSTILLRDKLHQLQQKGSISDYIREFLQIKISIKNISNTKASQTSWTVTR